MAIADVGCDVQVGLGLSDVIDIVDLIIFQKGRIPADMQDIVMHFPAQIGLTGQTFEDLRQGLVDGIEGDLAFQIRGDIYVDASIVREREKQFAQRNGIDHNSVGVGMGAWHRRAG